MKLYQVIYFFLISALVLVLLISNKKPAPQSNNQLLIMGIFPRRHPSVTVDLFTPLANYLTQKLGRRVIIETGRDFEDFWRKVRAKRYDIVHYNQYHYIRTHKEQGYQAIAMNEEGGRNTLTASIVVRKDSKIKSLKDLKGKKILFGGSTKAMISYIYATYLLREGGLKEGDYEYRFEANPPSAVIGAFHRLGNADAAGVGDIALELPIVKKQVDTKKMRYLVKGEQFAHIPWAVRGGLPGELKLRIQRALLDLNDSEEGKKILNKASLTGFVEAVDKDYDPHRRIVKIVTGEKY